MDSVAAWVQAIGSIAAVGSGFAYHAWQMNLSQRQRLLSMRDALSRSHQEILVASDTERASAGLQHDTGLLGMLIESLESNIRALGISLNDEIIVREAIKKLKIYIASWQPVDGSEGIHSTVERVFDALDVNGEFKAEILAAVQALERSYERLKRNPLRTY
jgi:hypothetical protein